MYILLVSCLILLISYHLSILNREIKVKKRIRITGSTRSEVRLRALKKQISSTWDDRGIAKKYKKFKFDETRGDPVDYISIHTTSRDTFRSKYLYTNTPCMILNIPDKWEAMKTWSFDNFEKRFGNTKFIVTAGGNVRLKYKYYYDYMKSPKHRNDDVPLYIFDWRFGDGDKKTRILVDEYEIPEWFTENLLDCLKKHERPPFRWLIMGPERTGSSLHVDPFATSAWNTLISGKKRWLLFPPGTFKKGTFDTSMMGALWYMYEYPKYKHLKHYDIIQKTGDTLFVPSDWWHVTLNLEDSIAITQNILTHNNIESAKKIGFDVRPKLYFKLVDRINDKLKETRTIDDVPYLSDAYASSSDD